MLRDGFGKEADSKRPDPTTRPVPAPRSSLTVSSGASPRPALSGVFGAPKRAENGAAANTPPATPRDSSPSLLQQCGPARSALFRPPVLSRTVFGAPPGVARSPRPLFVAPPPPSVPPLLQTCETVAKLKEKFENQMTSSLISGGRGDETPPHSPNEPIYDEVYDALPRMSVSIKKTPPPLSKLPDSRICSVAQSVPVSPRSVPIRAAPAPPASRAYSAAVRHEAPVALRVLQPATRHASSLIRAFEEQTASTAPSLAASTRNQTTSSSTNLRPTSSSTIDHGAPALSGSDQLDQMTSSSTALSQMVEEIPEHQYAKRVNCSVCKDAPVNAVIHPCMQFIMCYVCAVEWMESGEDCPCGMPIDYIIKTSDE